MTKEIQEIKYDIDYPDLYKAALTVDSGVEKLQSLMALQERHEAKHARLAYFSAIANFQSVVPTITKNGIVSYGHNNGNGGTNYKFAKMEDIAQAIREPLFKNNLSYRFEQKIDQSNNMLLTVTCVVSHKDGYSESAEMSGFPDQSGKKNPIQQLASTISYLKRYTLIAVLGITVSDDDDDLTPDAGYEEPKKNDIPVNTDSGKLASPAQITFIKSLCDKKNVSYDSLSSHFKISSVDEMKLACLNDAIHAINNGAIK